jgi:hypothetical protein
MIISRMAEISNMDLPYTKQGCQHDVIITNNILYDYYVIFVIIIYRYR